MSFESQQRKEHLLSEYRDALTYWNHLPQITCWTGETNVDKSPLMYKVMMRAAQQANRSLINLNLITSATHDQEHPALLDASLSYASKMMHVLPRAVLLGRHGATLHLPEAMGIWPSDIPKLVHKLRDALGKHRKLLMYSCSRDVLNTLAAHEIRYTIDVTTGEGSTLAMVGAAVQIDQLPGASQMILDGVPNVDIIDTIGRDAIRAHIMKNNHDLSEDGLLETGDTE